MDPLYDQKYSCPAAKKHRLFWRSLHSFATGLHFRYLNEEKDSLVEFNGYYRDPYMARLNKSRKRKELWVDAPKRRKTILEMQSRLKALAIAKHLGLDRQCGMGKKLEWKDRAWDTFEFAVERLPFVWQVWKEIDESLDIFEIVLLEWASATGEMRNHQAVACHVDANTSHFMESMTLFGKAPPGSCVPCTTAVENLHPGFLSFPLLGFAVEFRCGRDVLHLQLSRTMHVPDRSRDRFNWSWVHGP